MEIFGVGLWELLVIGIVALIILGPERLPEAARTVGRAIAEFRRAVEPAREAWRDLSNELTQVQASLPVARGNPWSVHPILQKMTPEERERFIAGGEMPPRVVEEIARLDTQTPAQALPDGELPYIDYPMPYSELPYQPATASGKPIEDIWYPPPQNDNDMPPDGHC